MKDFTRAQSQKKEVVVERPRRPIDLRCGRCGKIVKAFGIEPGDTCSQLPNTQDHNTSESERCGGKLAKMDPARADALKRKSDGAA